MLHSAALAVWTREQQMSPQYTYLRSYEDLHMSTQGFHELENQNFLKKEAFLYI